MDNCRSAASSFLVPGASDYVCNRPLVITLRVTDAPVSPSFLLCASCCSLPIAAFTVPDLFRVSDPSSVPPSDCFISRIVFLIPQRLIGSSWVAVLFESPVFLIFCLLFPPANGRSVGIVHWGRRRARSRSRLRLCGQRARTWGGSAARSAR